MFDMQLIVQNLPLFGRGLLMTLNLLGVSLLFGLLLAFPLSVLLISRNPWFSKPVRAYTYFFTGSPLLIQLFLVYYGFSQFEWMQTQWQKGNSLALLFREPYFCAVFTFALNTGAYTCEMLASALRNTSYGEVEAAQAIGMSRLTIFMRVLFPSAIRRAWPAYSNEVVLMLHASSVASLVTLIDLAGVGRTIYTKYYAPFEGYIAAGAIYLIITFSLLSMFYLLERRLLAYLQPRKSSRRMPYQPSHPPQHSSLISPENL